MAQRRMFSKSITNSSQFLMMPQSSQNLYFHLGMNADDDGFCEHFAIMRMTESKPDDLGVLQAKGFVNIFDNKVLVITNWSENNYIQKDRYTPSKYLNIYKKELKLLAKKTHDLDTKCIQDVSEMDTQVRLGKVRIVKDREEEDTTSEQSSQEIAKVIDSFKETNPSYKKWYGNKTQRAAVSRMLATHGLDYLLKIIALLPKSNKKDFMPVITTPLQLEDKFASLVVGLQKIKNKESVPLFI